LAGWGLTVIRFIDAAGREGCQRRRVFQTKEFMGKRKKEKDVNGIH